MDRGQKIAKLQQLAEDKIAIEAVADKQMYAANRAKEEDFVETPKQDLDKS